MRCGGPGVEEWQGEVAATRVIVVRVGNCSVIVRVGKVTPPPISKRRQTVGRGGHPTSLGRNGGEREVNEGRGGETEVGGEVTPPPCVETGVKEWAGRVSPRRCVETGVKEWAGRVSTR